MKNLQVSSYQDYKEYVHPDYAGMRYDLQTIDHDHKGDDCDWCLDLFLKTDDEILELWEETFKNESEIL